MNSLNSSKSNIPRLASHAGTWYSDNKQTIKYEIESYLSKAKKYTSNSSILKSIIVPHAGYRWSGPTAAWGFININPDLYDRVVILGPSHHSYIEGIGLTKCSTYQTPLGDISIDKESVDLLSKIEGFEILDLAVDEREHSLEMQLPYLRYIFGSKDFKLLPLMVGQTNLEIDRYFAKQLKSYFDDDKTLFVISSDFCHWGSRFRFTYHDEKNEYIYQSIEKLDRLGMDKIEMLSSGEFNNYLGEYKNTICGRRPISVLLAMIEGKFGGKIRIDYKLYIYLYLYLYLDNISPTSIKFVKYDQSSQVKEPSDSSVSYAVGLNYNNNI